MSVSLFYVIVAITCFIIKLMTTSFNPETGELNFNVLMDAVSSVPIIGSMHYGLVHLGAMIVGYDIPAEAKLKLLIGTICTGFIVYILNIRKMLNS